MGNEDFMGIFHGGGQFSPQVKPKKPCISAVLTIYTLCIYNLETLNLGLSTELSSRLQVELVSFRL